MVATILSSVLKKIQIPWVFISAFPELCDTYYGPHTRGCLREIFLEVGCVEQGEFNPSNLPANAVESFTKLNLR